MDGVNGLDAKSLKLALVEAIDLPASGLQAASQA
jgi:hypothetical protein